jgi:predicted nucleic acid-binding protein
MKTIYFDSNFLIYLIEQPPVFGALASLFLEQTLACDARLVTSDLALAECAYGAHKHSRHELATAYEQLPSDPRRISLVNVDSGMLAAAARLGPSSGLRLLDAAHVALALTAGCDEFVTNDRAFKAPLPIKVFNPFLQR